MEYGVPLDQIKETTEELKERYKREAKEVNAKFEELKERTGKKEWEIAAEFGMWGCFWCGYADNISFKRASPITCTKKEREFPQSYKCKTHFRLHVEKRRFILVFKKLEGEWRNEYEGVKPK